MRCESVKRSSLIAVVIVMLAMIFTGLPAKAMAKKAEKAIASHGSYGGAQSQVKKTTTIDWDGDGKKDKTVITTYFDADSLSGFAVTVNGKTAYEKSLTGDEGYGLDYSYFKMSSSKNFLRVRGSWDNMDSSYDRILFYNKAKKKFVQAADITGLGWTGTVYRTTGKQVTIRFMDQFSLTGMIKYDMRFVFNKGKLKLKSRYAAVSPGSKYKQYDGYDDYYLKGKYKAKQTIKFYKKVKGSKVAYTINKDEVVKLKRIYVGAKKRYFCFYKGSRYGWIEGKDHYSGDLFYGTDSRLAA